MTSQTIRRIGPPMAVQKARENVYVVQVPLSDPPNADWKRLFYDLPRDAPPDFPTRGIDLSGTILRFKSEPGQMAERIQLIDKWIERANVKEASFGNRSEEDRRRRAVMASEHQELAAVNESWSKL
ncbi:MAG: hypothetical protein HY046_14445 [Acidobacteria bacterium]|nr:hypothetical protein [Acidobacteriota bacterium]